jgi:hypothetical protein
MNHILVLMCTVSACYYSPLQHMLIIAIYGTMIYTVGLIRNAFDAGRYITRASGRWLGPGNRDFLGL